MNDDDNYKVKITTKQGLGIYMKTLFILIANHVGEVYFRISHDKLEIHYIDDGSIRIYALINNSQYGFEKFYCVEDIQIGVDIETISQLLKSVTAKDAVTFYVEKASSPEKIDTVGFVVTTPELSMTYEIVPIDLEINERTMAFDINDEDYPCDIKIESTGLNKVISNLKMTGGDVVNIRVKAGKLEFSSKGDKARAIGAIQQSVKESTHNVNKNTNKKDIIDLYVKAQKLHDIVKNTTLSQLMTLRLANDKLILLEYKINILGTIQIGLPSLNKPDIYD